MRVSHFRQAGYAAWAKKGKERDRGIAVNGLKLSLFYDYLISEQGLKMDNPVREGLCLRLPQPLPKHLKDDQVDRFLGVVHKPRDKAIFMLMLRSGLRVAEVAGLTLDVIDFRRGKILVDAGKGNKGRVVYVSQDGMKALVAYLKVRPKSKAKHIFLVEKGPCRGKPLSVRGIQKRMEYYARKAGLRTSSHQLRHHADSRIMPTSLLVFSHWVVIPAFFFILLLANAA